MELEIKLERITDSVAKRRAAGKDLGGWRPTFTDSQIHNALRLIETGEPATLVACDLGMSRVTLYRPTDPGTAAVDDDLSPWLPVDIVMCVASLGGLFTCQGDRT